MNKTTTIVSTWQRFYVCIEDIRVKSFNHDMIKRRRTSKQRPLRPLKLIIGLRLVEINPGPKSDGYCSIICIVLNARSLTSSVKIKYNEMESNLERSQSLVMLRRYGYNLCE